MSGIAHIVSTLPAAGQRCIAPKIFTPFCAPHLSVVPLRNCKHVQQCLVAASRAAARTPADISPHAHMVCLSKVLNISHTDFMSMVRRQPGIMDFAPETLEVTLAALAGALQLDGYHIVQAACVEPTLLVDPNLAKRNVASLQGLLGTSLAEVCKRCSSC